MSTSDAVTREAAWLAAVDSLPALLQSASGPWEIVQPYWPGSQLRVQATGIYVLRPSVRNVRVGSQRIRPAYTMRLKLHWPVRMIGPGASSIAAEEQQNLDDAIELLVQRIRGPLGDKSHGGRFLSAGETKGGQGITATYEDPEQTIKPAKGLRAAVSYPVDDFEISV